LQYIEKTKELRSALDRANNRIRDMYSQITKLEPENERLRDVERDYRRIRHVLGGERVEELVNTAIKHEAAVKEREIAARNQRYNRDCVR